MNIRDEFQWSKIGFKDVCFERFFTLQWRSPGILYVIYRLILAGYTSTILVLNYKNFQPGVVAWGAYLTNWTYSLLSIYFCYQALLTVTVYMCCSGLKLNVCKRMDFTVHKYLFTELFIHHTGYHYQQEERAENDSMDIVEGRADIPFYACITWILLNTASVATLLVSCVFWAVLVPLIPDLPMNQENLQLHLVNSLLILLEQCLSALPVRLLHIVFPLIYCSTYCIFSVFYWASDHSHVMYPILDWGMNPWLAIGCVLIIGIVLVPLLQFFLYGIYRIKITIFRTYCWN